MQVTRSPQCFPFEKKLILLKASCDRELLSKTELVDCRYRLFMTILTVHRKEDLMALKHVHRGYDEQAGYP